MSPGSRPSGRAMKRELLIEVGCEELPASWLPSLTRQLAERLEARLLEARLQPHAPVVPSSTPRRLVATVAELADRQADLEETVTGPPVSAAFGPDGAPTRAAEGFARKHGVAVTALARVETPKGPYLALATRHKGRPAPEVLPGVVSGLLRDLAFPKQMHWDAWLDDGRGELLFGRPIRWLVLLYGGRAVPFVIKRASAAEGRDVQEVHASNVTYGHRFLGGAGRPGRAIRVRSFEDYQARLAEHFVVLDRAARRATIAKELDAQARAHGGTVDVDASRAALLDEVPDLVEYPVVVAGTFSEEFLDLPSEVLKTTMIHHQHFFPVLDEGQRLAPIFLAVTNTTAENAETVSRNAGRVLTARLRDARFFWEADRKTRLESRLDRLDTVLFHKTLGSYGAKATRIERLAGWIAGEIFERPDAAEHAATGARLAKVDLTTEMVGEFPELQGIMGGVYAREEQRPEPVWKAIYYHYLPVGVDRDAAPAGADLGDGAVTWAAVALADKLDTIVGLFSAAERPTGSRDPFGLRRQAHGVFKILIDLPELTGLSVRPTYTDLLKAAEEPFGKPPPECHLALQEFMLDRLQYVLEQRGFDIRNVRAVTRAMGTTVRPLDALRKLQVLPEFTDSADFQKLAVAFKRVRNIARELDPAEFDRAERTEPNLENLLKEDAERRLLEELGKRTPVIQGVIAAGENYRLGFAEAAKFGPAVDRFFTEVFVMVDDTRLRGARLRLMKRLEQLILQLADISEIVAEAEVEA